MGELAVCPCDRTLSYVTLLDRLSSSEASLARQWIESKSVVVNLGGAVVWKGSDEEEREGEREKEREKEIYVKSIH